MCFLVKFLTKFDLFSTDWWNHRRSNKWRPNWSQNDLNQQYFQSRNDSQQTTRLQPSCRVFFVTRSRGISLINRSLTNLSLVGNEWFLATRISVFTKSHFTSYALYSFTITVFLANRYFRCLVSYVVFVMYCMYIYHSVEKREIHCKANFFSSNWFTVLSKRLIWRKFCEKAMSGKSRNFFSGK